MLLEILSVVAMASSSVVPTPSTLPTAAVPSDCQERLRDLGEVGPAKLDRLLDAAQHHTDGFEEAVPLVRETEVGRREIAALAGCVEVGPNRPVRAPR